MFPAPYFGAGYYPSRYWPKAMGAIVEGSPTEAYTACGRVPVFHVARRGAVYDRAGAGLVFIPQRRGATFDAPHRGEVFPVEEQ